VVDGRRDDGKRAVVSGDADPVMVTDCPAARPWGDDVVILTRKPFSVAPLGLAAMVDGSRLRRAIRARGNCHDHVFIEDRRPCARAALADRKTGNDLPARQCSTTRISIASARAARAQGLRSSMKNVIVAISASPNGATQPAAVTIAASPNGATENGFLVSITTSSPHGLAAGQSVTITGVGVAGYNGTFPIVATPSTTQFTYIAGASGLAASGAAP